MDIGQGTDAASGDRSRAGADGGGTFGRAAPAAFEFMKRGVELAPLAAREKAPLQRVLQAVVVFTFATAGQFGSSALNLQPVKNRMMPDAIVGPFANQAVELPPVVLCDLFSPAV